MNDVLTFSSQNSPAIVNGFRVYTYCFFVPSAQKENSKWTDSLWWLPPHRKIFVRFADDESSMESLGRDTNIKIARITFHPLLCLKQVYSFPLIASCMTLFFIRITSKLAPMELAPRAINALQEQSFLRCQKTQFAISFFWLCCVMFFFSDRTKSFIFQNNWWSSINYVVMCKWNPSRFLKFRIAGIYVLMPVFCSENSWACINF